MAFDIVQNLKNLKNLPKVWKVLNFDEVIEDNTRNAEKIQKNDYLENGKIAIVDQGQNLIAGYSNDEENAYCKYPLIIFGDHTRILKYIDFPIYLGADGTKLLDIKEEVADTKYVYYFLNTLNIPSTGYNRHFKYLKDVQIPLPPLNIQKKIADTLDKAQEIIDKRKEQISSLDKFLENLFLDMFGDPVSNPMGWEEEKILNCINKVENIKIKNNENLEIRYIDISSIDNLKNKVIGFQEYELISAPSRAKQKVFRNDILISLVRPNLKNIAILNFTYENMIASTGFCILRSSIKINPTYLFSLVKQDKFNDKLVNLTSGATYPAIKVSDVLEQIISLPPLDLQNQFASIVEKVEAEKTKLEDSLKEMEDNFNSIMQRAFKGELF